MRPKTGRNCIFVIKPAKQSWDMDTGFQGYLLLKITADCTLLNFSSFKVQDKSFWVINKSINILVRIYLPIL